MAKKKKLDPLHLIWDRVTERLVKEGIIEPDRHVIFSAYESDENDNEIDNLDEVVIKGQCIVVLEDDDYWGGNQSKTYISPVVTNPTWLDLCVLFNHAIIATNDHHHVFLEGVNIIRDHQFSKTHSLPENVPVYEFATGS